MKIAKRVMSWFLGTIILTLFILYAIDVHRAEHSVLHSEPADSENTDPIKQPAGEDSDAEPTINFNGRPIVYQSQEAAAAADGELSGQAGDGSQPDTDKNGQGSTSGSPDQTDSKTGSGKTESETDKTSSGSVSGNDQLAGSSKTDKSGSKTDAAANNDKTDKTDKNTSKNSKSGSKTDKTDKNDSKSGSDTKSKSGSRKNKSGKTAKSDTGKDEKAYTFQTVSEDYFSDALFIGDSRTVGMQQSGLLPEAAYYAKTGIGIGEILSERIVNEGGYLISVRDALSRHSFGKVYIMIGINDISAGDVEWFTEQYTEILNTVRATQPDAVIYIQGNIPMSYSTQDLHGSLNNKNLQLRDKASCALADSKNIFYLDVNTLYADANGHLASMYTTDGLHIKPVYYPLWVDYLEHRAIVR